MNRKKTSAVIGVVCVAVLIISLGFYFTRQETSFSWLSTNDFMVYQQDITWAGGKATKYMFWNVTAINGNLADLHLISHGVNFSNGNVSFPSADVTLTIDLANREVVASHEVVDSSTVTNSEMQKGSLWPFWIPTSVKVGDPIETWYGDSYISPSQPINVMGQTRDCWLVAYFFSAGKTMDRYYDTASGICLSIQVHIISNGIPVSVNETAVQTNLKLP